MMNCPHCQTTNHPKNAVCETCGAPLVADPALEGDPFVGRQLGGRFTLESIVGSGEIGMVYRGTDQRTGTAVAIKLVHPDVAATHGDELLRSASMVAQLRHAKIAQVLAAAREPDGTSYIVTEFLEGRTLKELMEEVGPVGPRRAADILFQLCSALAPIHRAGRPHANLKPDNVFLLARDGGDFVKIVDVGSPDLFGVRETLSGKIIIGTPKFFSPEQAMGQRVGLASDQFTLGVIGYRLLTGALPFFGATPDQLLAAIASGRPTPVTERVTGFTTIPEKLVHTVHRCLDKDPKSRYPDLRALATDLAAVIKSTPVDPAPAPKKKAKFGAGLDLSTRIANPGSLDSLFGEEEEDDDDDATRMASVPLGALDDALEPSSTVELLQAASFEAGAKTPIATTPRSRAPSQNDMAQIPEPLAVTGAIGADDLAAALADAMAGVDSSAPANPPSIGVRAAGGGGGGGGGGLLGDDLMAALDSAVAEVGGTPRAAASHQAAAHQAAVPGFGASAPLAPGGSGNGGFDPFGSIDLESDHGPAAVHGAPAASGLARGINGSPTVPEQRRSLPPGDMSNAILEALDEEMHGQDSGARKVSASAASPLATAADFAALSPIALEKARGDGRPGRQTLPPVTSAAAKGSRSLAVALVLLALLAVVGGGAFWWQQQEETAEAERASEAARIDAARKRRVREKAKQVALDAARVVQARLESTPPGATVKLGETELGVTPLDIEVNGVETLAYVLTLGGHKRATQLIEPKTIAEKIPDGEMPPVFSVTLVEGVDELEPKAPEAGAPEPGAPEPKKPELATDPVPAPAPARAPAIAPPPAAKPAAAPKEEVKKAPAPAPKPKKRTVTPRKKKKTPKKSDIKDPFAD